MSNHSCGLKALSQFLGETLGSSNGLALPDYPPFPPETIQLATYLFISVHIPLDLRCPVLHVTLGHSGPVASMPVPEASVNEQCDSMSWE